MESVEWSGQQEQGKNSKDNSERTVTLNIIMLRMHQNYAHA